MAEPNLTIASTGAAVVTLVTVAVGQLLGEYVVIFAMGLLGTLIALSENYTGSLKKSTLFLGKGIIFSIVFTGVVTSFILPHIPLTTGLTAYSILGVVSFMIGWSSNKMEPVRDWVIGLFTTAKAKNGNDK